MSVNALETSLHASEWRSLISSVFSLLTSAPSSFFFYSQDKRLQNYADPGRKFIQKWHCLFSFFLWKPLGASNNFIVSRVFILYSSSFLLYYFGILMLYSASVQFYYFRVFILYSSAFQLYYFRLINAVLRVSLVLSFQSFILNSSPIQFHY